MKISSHLRNYRNLFPLIFVLSFLVVAVLAPWISPSSDPENPLPYKLVESNEKYPLPPSEDIPLGTAVYYNPPQHLLHYDIFHSVIWGTRDALRFGLFVAMFSAILGTLIGAVSGYVGGWFNDLVMRITDAFLAFPVIAGVWLIQQIAFNIDYTISFYPDLDAVLVPLTARQRFMQFIAADPIMLALILFSWMPYARLINAGVLRLKNAEYVLAARTIGAKHVRMILRHLLPNAISPGIVLLARDIGAMVVLQTALSFIGLGGNVVSGMPEWSRLLVLGRTWVIGVGGNLLTYWWLYVPVTLTLVLFGIAWNVFGDRLNVLLNPREVN